MPSQQTIFALMEDVMKPDAHSYQSYVGLPALRKAWSDFYHRWYDVDLDPTCEMIPLIGSGDDSAHRLKGRHHARLDGAAQSGR